MGAAAYQVSYPAEWIMIASRRLSAGVHKVEITRGGVSLHAGNGDGVDPFNRTIGPLVIMPARLGVPTMRYGSVRELPRLCRSSRAVRWLEVTRPV